MLVLPNTQLFIGKRSSISYLLVYFTERAVIEYAIIFEFSFIGLLSKNILHGINIQYPVIGYANGTGLIATHFCPGHKQHAVKPTTRVSFTE